MSICLFSNSKERTKAIVNDEHTTAFEDFTEHLYVSMIFYEKCKYYVKISDSL